MFSIDQKRKISDAVQKILKGTNHPELSKGEIKFHLHVEGAESWSWADIKNNESVPNPVTTNWNEKQHKMEDQMYTIIIKVVILITLVFVGDQFLNLLNSKDWSFFYGGLIGIMVTGVIAVKVITFKLKEKKDENNKTCDTKFDFNGDVSDGGVHKS